MVVAVVVAGVTLLVRASYATYHVREIQSGNTFTELGDCREHGGASCNRPDRLDKMQNKVALAAGSVCERNGLRTVQITHVGDQRLLVVCR